MKKIVFFIVLVVLLLITFFVSRNENSQRAVIGDPESLEISDGRPLFAFQEKTQGVTDFVVGGEYLYGPISSSERWVFVEYKEDELGTWAVFRDEEGNTRTFGSNILVSFPEGGKILEAKKALEKDEKVQNVEVFESVRTLSALYENPFEAYLGYLRFLESPLFTSVSLDFEVTTMQNVDIAL